MKKLILGMFVLMAISTSSQALTLCPDGTYVAGPTCTLMPDGTYR